jgi:lipopolysaccharide export system protein LptA
MIKSEENVITGKKIVINQLENKINVFGDSTRRVEAEFFPGAMKQ